MIKHINFESDCKRIAKEIQGQAYDAVGLGSVEVIVSHQLIHKFNEDKRAHIKEWENEINKNLKGFKVRYQTLGYGHGWFIIFNIEHNNI